MRRFGAGWPFDIFDIVAVVGLALLGGSVWSVWPAAAGALVGVLLLTWALVSALPTRREP